MIVEEPCNSGELVQKHHPQAEVKSRAFAISSKVWVRGVEKSKSYRYVDKDKHIPVFTDTIEMGSFLHEAKMLWSNLTWLSSAEI